MKGYRIVKRGLTLALCAMLMVPTVQIAGGGLRVEAATVQERWQQDGMCFIINTKIPYLRINNLGLHPLSQTRKLN